MLDNSSKHVEQRTGGRDDHRIDHDGQCVYPRTFHTVDAELNDACQCRSIGDHCYPRVECDHQGEHAVHGNGSISIAGITFMQCVDLHELHETVAHIQ
ncbi:MAG: hypothetical protein ACK56F_05870 [bacterium]